MPKRFGWIISGMFYAILLGLSMNWAFAKNSQDIEDNVSELRWMIVHYTMDRSILKRTYNIPMAEKGYERMERFYRDRQGELEKLDFNTLSNDGRIDYLLFKNQLDHELRLLGIEEENNREITPLLPFWKTIVELEEERREIRSMDASKTADRINKLYGQIGQIQEEVKTALQKDLKIKTFNLKKTVVLRAVIMCIRLRNTLKRWFGFYNGYDPLFTWWVEEPYKKVDLALEEYTAFMREDIVGMKGNKNDGPIIGDPIGREALLSALAHAMIPYTPEELIDAGEKGYDWCEVEMIRASEELGYGKDWLKALEYVKTLHVVPGEQPHFIRKQALEAIEFLKKNDLITIPALAEETWRMHMMSPERQKVNPFFTGGEVISVSFPTNTMSHEDKLMSMRGNNMHFARATVHHELIPGHHLQGFMTDRHKSYRRVFSTPFWLEGWALHWEMLLWDLGFPQSPENRIGMLFWRMHRCARIIFSLSFHLGQMTPQECIDLLVNRVGHERANAVAEVRRSFGGSYEPLYQCAYMIGGLQLRALYHELVTSGRMTNRQFHDAVLKENSIPIVLLRAELTEEKLEESFTPDWKFLKE